MFPKIGIVDYVFEGFGNVNIRKTEDIDSVSGVLTGKSAYDIIES